MSDAQLSSEEINKRVADALDEQGPDDIVTLSSGVVVRVVSIPDGLFLKIYQRFPEPQAPMITRIDGSKSFEEPNYDDPTYQDALSKQRMALGEAMAKAEALKGTEIVSLPAGMLPFDEDKEWIEELDAIGLTLDPSLSRSARYIEWFLFRVAPLWDDRMAIQAARMAKQRVPAEEVESAEASFRG